MRVMEGMRKIKGTPKMQAIGYRPSAIGKILKISSYNNIAISEPVIPRLDRGIQKGTGCRLRSAGMTCRREWTLGVVNSILRPLINPE